MIIIRNLSSKESTGFKYKDNICIKCALKATGIIVILPSQDGFESNCPETKFQLITLQSQMRSSRMQMFFKIFQQENTCVGVSFLDEAPTQVFSYEHREIFKSSSLYRIATSGACYCQFDKASADLLLLIRNKV